MIKVKTTNNKVDPDVDHDHHRCYLFSRLFFWTIFGYFFLDFFQNYFVSSQKTMVDFIGEFLARNFCVNFINFDIFCLIFAMSDIFYKS